jgi:hypothetical protein
MTAVRSQVRWAAIAALALSTLALGSHLAIGPSGWRTALGVFTLLLVPGLGAVVWLPRLPADLFVATVVSVSVAVVVVVSAVTIAVSVYSPALAASISVALGLVALAGRVAVVEQARRVAA